MKFLFLLLVLLPLAAQAQIIRKENLTRKVTMYYDSKQSVPESKGSYYTDLLGETTEKHGKWTYYDKGGVIIEERSYYRGKLNGSVLAWYSNGKQRQEGYFKQDIQDSTYREWNENGRLMTEGAYFRGEPAGRWSTFYIDGRPKMVEEIIDTVSYVREFWMPDSLHTQTVKAGTGEMLTFYSNGREKAWYNYKNGVTDGAFEEYSVHGNLTIAGHFNEGLKDSLWQFWYYTGALEKTSVYKNGLLNGPYAYYYDNGQKNVEGQYEEGSKQGEWTWYTNKGTVDMAGSFKDDLQNGKWIYNHPTGELSYTASYKNGLKDGKWTYYYKDGTVFKSGNFLKDEKNGKWETWYEDGTLLMTGDYLNGKEFGLWKNYWENGKLKNEATFEEGVLEGDWKSFYPEGKTKLTGSYKAGNKTGEWINYFENGKPQDIVTYKVIKHKSDMEGHFKDHFTYESVKDGHSTSFSSKDYKKTEEGDYENGQKTGNWVAYYPGGKVPAVTTTYKKGELDGPMREYGRRGDLISEVDYKDGLKHGKMKIYDKKGNVAVEKDFEYGIQIIKTNSTSIQFKP